MRIGICGLSCECCTFSPSISTEADFQVLSGDALLESYDFLSDYPDAEFVPLVRARAIPGGSIDSGFYNRFRDRLLAKVKEKGPLDGLLMHMHGAANVVGLDDAEGDLLAAIRRTVGPTCFLSASYDLHGNVSQEVFKNLDILTAYRTAPHSDWKETVRRAFSLLIDCLRRDRRPAKALVAVPILLPGERTSTDWEPAASLYASLPSTMERFRLLDASILTGYVWADEPRACASVTAFGTDQDETDSAAAHLAERFWDLRHEFRFGVYAGPVDECIEKARAAAERPVFISDSGDNPTAGGAGDVPYVLDRLVKLNAREALYVSIADPAAVALSDHAGVGAEVELDLGGKLDPVNGTPLRVRGRVLSIASRPWALSSSGDIANRIVVLKVGDIDVIVTERRTPFHYREDFLELGVDPLRYSLVGVKIGYLVPELKRMAALSLLALSPGAVNQDVTRLPYARITRPMYPFDPEMEWKPPR